ncbi:hypothetical protein M434DRAFT_151803 [Hypoxylon sp. CO27-5]|nr:hypothetical protein M434DRAFT_151803 [Hypoxylon sp. CO27-5]
MCAWRGLASCRCKVQVVGLRRIGGKLATLVGTSRQVSMGFPFRDKRKRSYLVQKLQVLKVKLEIARGDCVPKQVLFLSVGAVCYLDGDPEISTKHLPSINLELIPSIHVSTVEGTYNP